MTSIKNTATLLVTCPDQKGIVAAIANFLLQHDANILHADQHQDSENNLFLMRVEWDLNGSKINEANFAEHFADIAKQFKMEWQLKLAQKRPRLAIMVSQYDHCLADLLHRHQSGELACEIAMIVSNHLDTAPLAEFYGIPFHNLS